MDGPRLGLGATYRTTARVGRSPPAERVFTTVGYEPDRRVAFRSERAYDTVYELEEEDGATRLTCEREYDTSPSGSWASWPGAWHSTRLVARSGFVPARVIPNIEWALARIEAAMTR